MTQIDDLKAEFHVTVGVMIMAIVHATHEETGETRGTLRCPKCETGTLTWSIAENGHARAECSREVTDTSLNKRRCVALMQ